LLDLTNAGGWYAAEPLKSAQNHQLYWEIESVRFHHPAEHKINGTTYDLEMQIFAKDYYSRKVICMGEVGATSIFFKLGDENKFFDWQADATAGNPV